MASLLQPSMAPFCAARNLCTSPAPRGMTPEESQTVEPPARAPPGAASARHVAHCVPAVATCRKLGIGGCGVATRLLGRRDGPSLVAAAEGLGAVPGGSSAAQAQRGSGEAEPYPQLEGPSEGISLQGQVSARDGTDEGKPKHAFEPPSSNPSGSAPKFQPLGQNPPPPPRASTSSLPPEARNRAAPKPASPEAAPPGSPPPNPDLQKLLQQLRGLSAELAQRPGFAPRPAAAPAPGGAAQYVPGASSPGASSAPPQHGGATSAAAAPPRPPAPKPSFAARQRPPSIAGGRGDESAAQNGTGPTGGGASSAGGSHGAADLEWVRRSELTAVRSRLNKKLSEANAHTRHLVREMEERENVVKSTRRELAVVEAQLAEVVALAKELALSRGEAASKKVNGKYLTSLLAMRLEEVQEGVRKQAAGIKSVDLREFPITWYGMAEDVRVMGSFDGWTKGEQLSPEGTGTFTKFTTNLKLRPGRYEVKFQVDGDWRIAPDWPTVGEGLSMNNLLVVD